MKPETKHFQNQQRTGVRKGALFPAWPATAKNLRDTADAIDTIIEHAEDRPEMTTELMMRTVGENNVAPQQQLGFARAERLRLLADKIEREEGEVAERLAKAGEAAAEAQRMVEDQRHHIAELTAKLTATRAEVRDMERMAYDRQALIDQITAERNALMQLGLKTATDLAHEQQQLKIAHRVIASLVEEIESAERTGDADAEIQVIAGAPIGLTPEQASEILVAAMLDSELVGLGR